MTDPTDDTPSAEAIDRLRDLGAALTEEASVYVESAPDLLTTIVPTGYHHSVLNLSQYDYLRPTPRRVHGRAVVTDTASWLAYFGKYGGETSEVYGDVIRSTVTALLNAPADRDGPAWGDHRAVLQLQHSTAWDVWVGLNDTWVTQDTFAEHIEARTPDLVQPDAATMLELAQSFHATTGVEFQSGSRLHDGQRRFSYLETVEGKAGNRGQIDIPTSIELLLQVWRGVGIQVPVTARFRFRAGRDGLKLGIVLDRIDDVLDAAWSSLLGELTGQLRVPVLAGQAPDYAG